MSALRTNVWFGGKLISENSNAVFPDRVGTNRASGARFHPYGDEITSTANDREKFAAYTRDSYTGVDYADQRYYASSYGRFNTPDPDGGGAKPSEPGSWNRFAYVSGDPVNLRDRRGLEEQDCRLDYEEDGTIDPGCCDPTAYWSGGEQDFACSTDGGIGGGGGSSPPRWQDINRQGETLEDLAENIDEIADPNLTNSSEVAAPNSILQTSISVEVAALAANISSGSSTPPGSYNGGHYNLTASTAALQAALGADYSKFAMEFGGRLDGTRQAAVYGNPAQGNFTLHSKEHGRRTQDHYSFHFDLYNPLSGDLVNFLGHVFGDVIFGNTGSPSLDPAWQ